MKTVLTYDEMQNLITCGLYTCDGYTATPNLRHLKPNAPSYLLNADATDAWFEKLTPDNAPETDYSGCHRDA